MNSRHSLYAALLFIFLVNPGIAAPPKKAAAKAPAAKKGAPTSTTGNATAPEITADPSGIAPILSLLSYAEAYSMMKEATPTARMGIPEVKKVSSVSVLQVIYPVQVDVPPGVWLAPKLTGFGKLPAPFVMNEAQRALPFALDFTRLKGGKVIDNKLGFQGFIPAASGFCTAYWIVPSSADALELSLRPAAPIRLRLKAPPREVVRKAEAVKPAATAEPELVGSVAAGPVSGDDLRRILPGKWVEKAAPAAEGMERFRCFHVFDEKPRRIKQGLMHPAGAAMGFPDSGIDNIRILEDEETRMAANPRGTIVYYFPTQAVPLEPERWLVLSLEQNRIVYKQLTRKLDDLPTVTLVREEGLELPRAMAAGGQ